MEDNDELLQTSMTTNSSNGGSDFWVTFSKLWEVCEDNYAYFSEDESALGQKLFLNFEGIKRSLEQTKLLAEDIQSFAHEYDFKDIPANGYRSFLKIAEYCLESMFDLLFEIAKSREHVFFRKSWYVHETRSCEVLLSNVCCCLKYTLTLRKCSDSGNLFPNNSFSEAQLNAHTQSIDHACFFGSRLGFQYCSSMRSALRFLVSCMAGFSHMYYSQSGATSGFLSSIWNGCRYHLSPETRAKKVGSLILEADVGFCKAFWLLAESKAMETYSFVVRPPVQTNRLITIPPERLTYFHEKLGVAIQIPIPNSHFGPASMSARLISSKHREGMIGEFGFSEDIFPAADSLIVHCHGGGFVAQSSKSHEVYLCEWAMQLDIPILSIDYSLAPQSPYPRALEEVFYIYCWVLNNSHLLGSKGKRIILAGDSAGANLCISTSLKCLQFGIRKPDGLFIAYCPVLVASTPSPARLLSLMDPLVPFGFLRQCLEAYVMESEKVKKFNAKKAEAITDLVESAFISKNMKCNHSSAVKNGKKVDNLKYIAYKANGENRLNCKRVGYIDFVFNIFKEVHLASNYLLQGIRKSLLKDRYIRAVAKHISWSKHIFQQRVRFPKWTQTSSVTSRQLVTSESHVSLRPSSNHIEFTAPNDPYMSPYLAPLEDLQQLPSTNILSVEMDPCLDDCVMFAKKLDLLGVKVNLDVVPGLPHGFLNLISKEAEKGSQLCVQRIKELLVESIV